MVRKVLGWLVPESWLLWFDDKKKLRELVIAQDDRLRALEITNTHMSLVYDGDRARYANTVKALVLRLGGTAVLSPTIQEASVSPDVGLSVDLDDDGNMIIKVTEVNPDAH